VTPTTASDETLYQQKTQEVQQNANNEDLNRKNVSTNTNDQKLQEMDGMRVNIFLEVLRGHSAVL
jgi:hypothetical protein